MSLLLPNLLNFAAAKTFPSCDPSKENAGSFLNFPHWWDYIHTGIRDATGTCIPHVGFPEGIWAIGLAALDILLFAAGFLAVVSIIIAGFQYVTTMGNSEEGVKARRRIVNSVIGLVIALVAAAFVSFIGKRLGG